jgi:uncharacterized protein (TIGR03000 family)
MMARRSVLFAAVAGLALLFTSATPAQAWFYWGPRVGVYAGWYPYTGYSYYYTPYYSYYSTPVYSYYATPAYSSYSTPGYSYYTPQYASTAYYAPEFYYGSPGVMRSSAYYSPATTTDEEVTTRDDAAHLRVRVPADADLWFQGIPMQRSGSVRDFVSPRLNPGKKYTYDIEARWMEGDRAVDVKRTITVRANDWLDVDLMRPAR